MTIRNKILCISVAVLAVLGMTIDACAAPSADLDQCRNGPADKPVNCTGSAWVNGNVGAQQGHLAEGYSIPYRVRMYQLPPGTQISLILGYDIKHSDAHALDYLTFFERLDNPTGSHLLTYGHLPEFVDPSSGVNFNGPTTTFPIPSPSSAGTPVDDQPNASFNNLTAGEKLMTLYGGTITDIQYVTQGDLTASQSETRIMVNFTTNSTCPVNNKNVQQCTAVLSWGGHIGSRLDWGYTNGVPNSAGGISGSPYHMRLIGWNLNNLGQQDRSLSAAAVSVAPATIIIIKNTIPNGEQLFHYTTMGLNDFYLKDNGISTNSTTFGGLAAGAYSVTEDSVTGFNLTDISCIDPTGDTTTDLGTRTASINLVEGETVTCTFENTKNATLTVVKDAIPDDDQNFSFTGDGGIGDFQLKDDGTSTNSTTFSLVPGTYNVSETVPADWELTDVAGEDSLSGTTATVILAAGENRTVTFTNTKNATLTVVKDAIPDDDQNFSFTGDGGIGDFQLKDDGTSTNSTTFSLVPGTYNVSETVPADWALTDVAGEDSLSGTTATVILAAGENRTVTFTNTKNATLTVVKDAIPDDDQDFSFTGDGGIGDFQLKDDGTSTNSTTFSLVPGTYNVSEAVPKGWALTNTICSDGSSVDSIELDPGENVTCTFTNAKLYLSFIKAGVLDFAGQTTNYNINVTNSGFANLTIVNMTDESGNALSCDTPFPRLLTVNDKISCTDAFDTDSNIDAATIIEILSHPTNIFWKV